MNANLLARLSKAVTLVARECDDEALRTLLWAMQQSLALKSLINSYEPPLRTQVAVGEIDRKIHSLIEAARGNHDYLNRVRLYGLPVLTALLQRISREEQSDDAALILLWAIEKIDGASAGDSTSFATIVSQIASLDEPDPHAYALLARRDQNVSYILTASTRGQDIYKAGDRSAPSSRQINAVARRAKQ